MYIGFWASNNVKFNNVNILNDNVSMIYRTQPFSNSIDPSTLKNLLHAQAKHKSTNESTVLAEPSDMPTKWIRTVSGSPVLLFRYSALTFNAHMIHYDQSYSNSEGFETTLVHGPLQAQLLLDLVHRIFPFRPILEFNYRGMNILFLHSFTKNTNGIQ